MSFRTGESKSSAPIGEVEMNPYIFSRRLAAYSLKVEINDCHPECTHEGSRSLRDIRSPRSLTEYRSG